MHHKTKVMEEKRYPQFEEEEGVGMCCEPASDNAMLEYASPLLENYDKIADIGPQSVEEMYADLSVAEKEMKDPQQWDTLNNFMTGFKQTHATWFK